jgi:hypothetical protein
MINQAIKEKTDVDLTCSKGPNYHKARILSFDEQYGQILLKLDDGTIRTISKPYIIGIGMETDYRPRPDKKPEPEPEPETLAEYAKKHPHSTTAQLQQIGQLQTEQEAADYLSTHPDLTPEIIEAIKERTKTLRETEMETEGIENGTDRKKTPTT